MTKRTCSVEGCPKDAYHRGWCHTHYERWRTGGDPCYVRVVPVCSIDGCTRPVRCKALCREHYKEARWASYGTCSVDGCERFVAIKMHGMCTLHHVRLVKSGSVGAVEPRKPKLGPRRNLTSSGYIRIHEPDHPLAMGTGWVFEHRKVMWDAGLLVDQADHVHHINHDKTDNRIENLAVLTSAEHKAKHRKLDHDEIVRLYALGLSQSDVARSIGCHSATVCRILQKRGIPAHGRR